LLTYSLILRTKGTIRTKVLLYVLTKKFQIFVIFFFECSVIAPKTKKAKVMTLRKVISKAF